MQFSYDPSFELPRTPGAEPGWEEGALFWFFDRQAGVGAVAWIQQNPRLARVVSWCGVIGPDGQCFRANRMLALEPGDRDGVLGAGPTLHLRPEEDRLRLVVREPDCEVAVEFVDLFRPVSQFSADDLPPELAEQFPVRFETAGTVRGRVRLGANEYDVDGLGFRDRGWGTPDWDQVTNHRWLFGTLGPELSYSAVSVHNSAGFLVTMGYVARDGEVTRASGVDIVVHMEADGLTHRGGEAKLELPDGTVSVACSTVAGVLFELLPEPTFWTLESFCRASVGTRAGVANLEMINNPRRGMQRPSLAVRASMQDGLGRA